MKQLRIQGFMLLDYQGGKHLLRISGARGGFLGVGRLIMRNGVMRVRIRDKLLLEDTKIYSEMDARPLEMEDGSIYGML